MLKQEWHSKAISLHQGGLSGRKIAKELGMGKSRDNMVGRVFPTNNGGDCVIVEYISSTRILIRFLDEKRHEVWTSMKSVRLGTIRNPFARSVYNIGYLGAGKHKTAENGVHTKAYILWGSLIERCYSEASLKKNPTYIGCTVSEDWHNFQNFADWFYEQPFNNVGYHLDKDLLSKGEKRYSADNCCFVPQEINNLFNKSEATRTNMPQGVYLNKKTGSFVARLSVGTGKIKHLGSFKNAEEAFVAYKKGKEGYVKERALFWQGGVVDEVFQALMNWELT